MADHVGFAITDFEPPLTITNIKPVGRTNIPPRPWAYGHYLQFRQASCLAGVDGGGKSAMTVVIALAMITGLPLLGEKVWRKGPAGIITYEDDIDEWHRRIAAACGHYGLEYESALSDVYFIVRERGRICFAEMSADRTPIYPDGDEIITLIQQIGLVLLIIDPLNHAHAFDDGNNNAVMAKVAAEINRVCHQSGAAGLVLHHLRKGATGIADDMMGATAIRATFRSSRILSRMTSEEASALCVTDDIWRYSRISGSKENYAPPPDKASWFRLESRVLGNTGVDPTYPDGDEVQVTTIWEPAPLLGIDPGILARAADRIRQGPGDGQFFSPWRTAKLWVGKEIAIVTGMTPDEAARVVKQWIDQGVLVVDTYTSPTRRAAAERVQLNEEKVAEILSAASSS